MANFSDKREEAAAQASKTAGARFLASMRELDRQREKLWAQLADDIRAFQRGPGRSKKSATPLSKEELLFAFWRNCFAQAGERPRFRPSVMETEEQILRMFNPLLPSRQQVRDMFAWAIREGEIWSDSENGGDYAFANEGRNREEGEKDE